MSQSLLHLWRTAQSNAVVGLDGQHQHGQNPCALRLRHAVGMKGLGHGRGGGLRFGGLRFGCKRHPARQGLQHLPRLRKVTLPMHGGTCTRQSVGRVGVEAVIHCFKPFGCGRTAG